MASGDQVMRISGDFSGYVAGAKRAEEATGKIGKQAVKMAEGFTGSLIRVELLKKAVNAVLQGMDRINEKNLAASRTHDDRMMSIGTAAGTLGVDGNILKEIIQERKGAGSKNTDEDINFLESMASMNKSRPAPMGKSEIIAAMQAFHDRGTLGTAAGGSELLEGLAKGQDVATVLDELQKKRGKPMPGALRATVKSNKEDNTALMAIEDQRMAGDDMRELLRKEQAAITRMPDGVRKNTSQFIQEWMPNAIKGFLVGNGQDMETMRKENEAGNKDQAAAAALGQAIGGTINATINKTLSRPNMQTEVK